METLKTIPPAVAAIIPAAQLQVTQNHINDYSDAINHIYELLVKCPKLYETDGMKEHPAIFHYFFGGTDIYICEYDTERGLMFGFHILNGDLDNSEWGYSNVKEYASSKYLNIDYHFEEQSIEAALYKRYPKHFKKPKSLTE
jgi:hypothetical protein